jgi:hypothetical protein
MYIVQSVGPSDAVPATPAPEGRRVHFDTSSTPSPITLDENQAIRHQSHHQSQADDPFVGPGRDVVADAHTQVCIHYLSIF